jgi:glycine/D-amino acid oxidase-like deaminating enzyme
VVGATDRPGLHVATGMNGQGVTLAPAVGDLFARGFDDSDGQRTDGEDAGLLAALAPGRF